MKKISIQTRQRTEFVDLTAKIRAEAKALGLQDGCLTVFVPHTTAGVTINEHADPDVVADMEKALNRLVPWEDHYQHSEGNSAAHIKASLMGSSVQVLVENGDLRLGTWQGIFFCEFDGPRSREVWVKASKQ
jgi:secondary thiamine-phosphate synthase enzyme